MFKGRKTAGFTLIESVLSVTIIAAGLIGVLFAFQNSVHNSLLADQTIVAINLGRETLERIAALRDCNNSGCGYDAALTAVATNHTFDQNPVSGFPNFRVDATAAVVDPDNDSVSDDFLNADLTGTSGAANEITGDSGYARVGVTVRWNNGSDFLTLETLMTDD